MRAQNPILKMFRERQLAAALEGSEQWGDVLVKLVNMGSTVREFVRLELSQPRKLPIMEPVLFGGEPMVVNGKLVLQPKKTQEIKNGRPQFDAKGRPKMVVATSIQTQEPSEDDITKACVVFLQRQAVILNEERANTLGVDSIIPLPAMREKRTGTSLFDVLAMGLTETEEVEEAEKAE